MANVRQGDNVLSLHDRPVYLDDRHGEDGHQAEDGEGQNDDDCELGATAALTHDPVLHVDPWHGSYDG